MLEHNIVISDISEEKWENLEPRRDKVNKELAKIMSDNTPAEWLENASKLNIMITERLGHYNPLKGRPISVKFVRKKDVDLVLANKKILGSGIFMDKQYSDETEFERKYLWTVLSAARKLSTGENVEWGEQTW